MIIDEKQMVEEEIVETTIDIKKTYKIPKDVEVVNFNSVYLAIYTKGILWIVLENEEELAVFNSMRDGMNIEFLYKNYSEEAVINVIMQVEAKKFEQPKVIENNETSVYIYLTNNCNQRCKHCYMYAGDIKVEEVDAEKWIPILDNLKRNNCKGVTFTGGEITVYNGFDLLIKHAHNIGLLVTILSNGIAWNEKMIDELYPYIDEVQVSLDGYDSESYFDVRRYDGFEKAINCIKLFANRGTKVSMAVTPLFNNLDEFIDKFEKFALDFMDKFPSVFIKLNHELISGREVQISKDKNDEYRKKLKLLVERLYPNYYTETFVLNYEDKSIRKNCGFGGISIAANGNVYWCNRIHELKSTINVFNSDMTHIFELGERIKNSTSVDNTIGCKDCNVRYICGGGCRMKYKEIIDVDTHEGNWEYKCEGKEHLYKKMILSNEYFFEE